MYPFQPVWKQPSLRSTEVPNSARPINTEASTGGNVEAPGPASVAPLICCQGQAGPLRHLADPEGAGVGEGRQQGEVGWGDGAT